jgi:hypothetical protein
VDVTVGRLTVRARSSSLVAAVLVATLSLIVGSSAPPTGASSAATVASVPVVQCPTRQGGDLGPPVHLAATLPEHVAATLVGKVELYADRYDIVRVLGPMGWSCVASVAVDGGEDLLLYPPGTASPGYFHIPTGRSNATGLTVQVEPACLSCRLTLVCPFFASARHEIESVYASASMMALCVRPAGEVITRSSPSTRFFTDGPHVLGHAYPSGGPDSALGVAYFNTKTFSYLVTCTLATNQRSLCRGALNWFVGFHRPI